VCVIDDIDFLLANADGFHNNDVFAHRLHHVNGITRRMGKSAQSAPGSERPYKHARIFRMPLHADSVAQYGATGKRTGGVNGQNADGFIFFAQRDYQSVGQRAFARARRAGYTNDKGFTGIRVKFFDFRFRFGKFVFDISDEARGQADIARADFFNQRIHIKKLAFNAVLYWS